MGEPHDGQNRLASGTSCRQDGHSMVMRYSSDPPAQRGARSAIVHRASDMLYEDAMIAATAKVHNLTVVTRNVTDFKPFGVKVLNPFVSVRK